MEARDHGKARQSVRLDGPSASTARKAYGHDNEVMRVPRLQTCLVPANAQYWSLMRIHCFSLCLPILWVYLIDSDLSTNSRKGDASTIQSTSLEDSEAHVFVPAE